MTPWTVALHAPLFVGFSRQEYWSELPFPSPGDLLHPGIELASLLSLELAGRFFTTSATWKAKVCELYHYTSSGEVWEIVIYIVMLLSHYS